MSGALDEIALGIAGDRSSALPLLADPDGYCACRWNLRGEAERFAYWIDLFRRHFDALLEAAVRERRDAGEAADVAQARARQAGEAFEAYLQALVWEPAGGEPLTVLSICEGRERVLREAGITDPYRLEKSRENAKALAYWPSLAAELDAMEPAEVPEALIRGVLAGNIFDLGATETAERFSGGSVDFQQVRAELAPRPWRFDGLDAWRALWADPARARSALLLVDNAGADLVLGMLPLARGLLRRGGRVLLGANTTPTLNDVTHAELEHLLDRVAGMDTTIAEARATGRLETVETGNGVPLIDLGRISAALAEATARRGVDLLVIEGMGRAIESNFDARFSVDTLKIAMLKDPWVARELGGEVYDLVVRVDEPG